MFHLDSMMRTSNLGRRWLRLMNRDRAAETGGGELRNALRDSGFEERLGMLGADGMERLLDVAEGAIRTLPKCGPWSGGRMAFRMLSCRPISRTLAHPPASRTWALRRRPARNATAASYNPVSHVWESRPTAAIARPAAAASDSLTSAYIMAMMTGDGMFVILWNCESQLITGMDGLLDCGSEWMHDVCIRYLARIRDADGIDSIVANDIDPVYGIVELLSMALNGLPPIPPATGNPGVPDSHAFGAALADSLLDILNRGGDTEIARHFMDFNLYERWLHAVGTGAGVPLCVSTMDGVGSIMDGPERRAQREAMVDALAHDDGMRGWRTVADSIRSGRFAADDGAEVDALNLCLSISDHDSTTEHAIILAILDVVDVILMTEDLNPAEYNASTSNPLRWMRMDRMALSHAVDMLAQGYPKDMIAQNLLIETPDEDLHADS